MIGAHSDIRFWSSSVAFRLRKSRPAPSIGEERRLKPTLHSVAGAFLYVLFGLLFARAPWLADIAALIKVGADVDAVGRDYVTADIGLSYLYVANGDAIYRRKTTTKGTGTGTGR